ncbi:MAG: PTS sugar transporter subunit IIA [Planctomycetota bacterium]|jgi:mannitol/fructose-specific phosphotransferase system IIA component (Ntr-type)
MKFADFVCFEAVILGLKAEDRNGVIGELVEALSQAGKLARETTREIIDAMIERENEASTGMGKGIALPHVKHNAVEDVVATIGISNSGIDFRALDKLPVYSVILLISPREDPDRHLQAMELIFRHLQNDRFRKFLGQSQTAEQIRDLFREADENLFFN